MLEFSGYIGCFADFMDSEGVLPKDPNIVDIDSLLNDPQACTLYAPDIYSNIRTTEV